MLALRPHPTDRHRRQAATCAFMLRRAAASIYRDRDESPIVDAFHVTALAAAGKSTVVRSALREAKRLLDPFENSELMAVAVGTLYAVQELCALWGLRWVEDSPGHQAFDALVEALSEHERLWDSREKPAQAICRAIVKQATE